MEKGIYWMTLPSISSQFFTIGFSVGTESPNHVACSTCVPICASTYAKIFIVSLTVSDLCFPLLSIFHPLDMKFVLVYNKTWSFRSEVIWAQENQIIWPGPVKCCTYENTKVAVLQWSFFGTPVRNGRDKIHSLSYYYTMMHQVQSWPDVCKSLGTWQKNLFMHTRP
jgi:hypothetical protein